MSTYGPDPYAETYQDDDGNVVQPVTESHDSDQPHVHHVAESALWWADTFPQWRGQS